MLETNTIIILVIGVFSLIAGIIIGKNIGTFLTNISWEKKLPAIRKQATQKSRAVIGGQFSEQLAPYLPDFNHDPTEAKFLGKPVDFIVFEGLNKKHVDKVVFLEVKSGTSRLSSMQKTLKEAIQNKQVYWEEYKVPQQITQKQ